MDELLAGLNEAQRCAVSSPASVLQVLAPPGSGKTKTLTARVAYLMNHVGIEPWNIIVCTFTIKAAREMKERIRSLVGDGTEAKLILGTFHSVARRFLVYYGHHIGIDKNFGIADTSDTLAIIKRIIKRRSYGTEPSVARSRISGLKAKSVRCDQFAATVKQAEQQEFAAIYSEYEESLKTSNLLDYDDLLLRCVDLLRSRPECVSNIQAVLIDEFQDTNHVQYELMSLMAQNRRHITIVGDPDQSIYGFRSAEIKNLQTMQQHYPETVVVILEENYRSSAAILQSALEVIEQDESRPVKKLLPTHCVGEIPVLRRLPSAAIEAAWIVTEIQRSQALTGKLLTNSDFAVLLRSAALSRHIESALGKAGIPYRVVGGMRFFDRMEVKLLLDYLRVINRPDHSDALVRIINTPSRKIGEVTVRSLLEEAEENKTTLWRLILSTAQGNRKTKTKLTSQAAKGLQSFVNVILTSQKKISTDEGPPCSLLDLLGHVMKKTSFEDYLKKTHPEDFEGRWANVEELVAQATDVSAIEVEGANFMEEALPHIKVIEQREISSAEDALARFLANVALSTEVQQEEGAATDQVTISTIHAAKGLEWPVVFIPAVYDGSIPHSRAEDHDEERRLLYVGMTRAQSLLYLSCPLKNSQTEQTTLSSFLSHQKMSRFFDVQGPRFGYNATQNLARILRRVCPTLQACNESRSLVERLQDDYYPLDGTDPIPEIHTSRNDLNPRGEFASYQYSKRRRLNDTVPVDLSGTGISVTMHQPEKLSVSGLSAPGFISAGVHLREVQAEAELKVAIRAEQKEAHRESIAQLKREMSKKDGSLKRPAGQGSITSFFGKPVAKKPVVTPEEQVQEAVDYVREKKMRTKGNSNIGMGSGKQFRPPKPLKEIENINTEIVSTSSPQDRPSWERTTVRGANGTNCIPATATTASSLPAHKLRTQPMLSRPARPQYQDDYGASKPYSFMSSSPPQPDDEGDNSTAPAPIDPDPNPGDTPPPPPPTSLLVDPTAATSASTNGFQPASSLHTTSMDQAAQRAVNASRRTLGMRRSMQGWGAGGGATGGGFQNKPFVAPGRRKM